MSRARCGAQAQLARAHVRHGAVRHERHGFRTHGVGRIQNGHKRLAKSCLRAGSNVNSQNLKGQTPLHFCFAFGYPDRPPKPKGVLLSMPPATPHAHVDSRASARLGITPQHEPIERR